jgi:hypothetical protein
MTLNINAPPPYSYTAPAYSPAPLPRYVPTSSRAKIVIVLLIVGAVLSIISSFISLSELILPGALFGDEESTDPLTLAIALLVLGFGLLTAIVYIATVVFFLMWLYRAHENLQAFGVRKNQLEYSSGWAVGSFFVPFASLIIPYRAIRELWRKSIPESSNMFGSIAPPGFFSAWWAFWIFSNMADQMYLRMTWSEKVSTDVSATVGVVSGILGTIAAVLAIKVVREIEKQQTESSRLLNVQSTIPNPPAPPEFFQDPGGTYPVSSSTLGHETKPQPQ